MNMQILISIKYQKVSKKLSEHPQIGEIKRKKSQVNTDIELCLWVKKFLFHSSLLSYRVQEGRFGIFTITIS